MRKNNKTELIVIIILLFIFIPLSLIGFINRPKEVNKDHKFYSDGFLWFYNEEELLSKYECLTDICELSSSTIDDDKYEVNYYKDGTLKSIPIINNDYAFIKDGEEIILYDITSGISLQKFASLKNYNTTIDGDAYILKSENGKWGVISVGSKISPIVPFEYDFIGLNSRINSSGDLLKDKLIVMTNNRWFIINDKNDKLTSDYSNPVIDYTDKYVFTKSNGIIKIFSYDSTEYVTNLIVKDYSILDNYIALMTNNFVVVYNDLSREYLKSVPLSGKTGKIYLERNGNIINIKLDDTIIDNIS